MTLSPEILSSLLERAATEPIGLAIETNNVRAFLNLLSEHRKSLADLRFNDLVLATPSIPDHIFIYRRSMSLDP